MPSNFLINKLLSELDGQPAASHVCSKHKGKKFKLFCQTCDQLICKDCALIDHRDHDYKFVNDVYPAEKDKIVKIIEKSKEKITALETSLMTIESQEYWARHKFEEVSSKVDALINDHIKALERKRQSLKEQLQKFTRVQKHLRETQKKSFTASLNRVKRSVELAEQTLKKGDELRVLETKHEIIQRLTDTNSATEKIQARGMISCNLEIDHDSTLYDADIQKIAKITQCDEEYTLAMLIGGVLNNKDYASKDNSLISTVNVLSRFEIQSKNDNKPHWAEAVDDVQVNIKQTGSNDVNSPVIEQNKSGSFTFSYCPVFVGKYEIEVLVNGRYLEGTPFTWEVKMSGISREDFRKLKAMGEKLAEVLQADQSLSSCFVARHK